MEGPDTGHEPVAARAVAFQQPLLLRCVAESLNESRSLCVGRLEEFVVFT